jgi:hypothetical protein
VLLVVLSSFLSGPCDPPSSCSAQTLAALPCIFTPTHLHRPQAEAVQLANNTQYGLAAYFYTRVGLPAFAGPGLPGACRSLVGCMHV